MSNGGSVSWGFDPSAVSTAGARVRYDEAMGVLDGIVAAVPHSGWDAASPCPGWSARDVLGHLVWGQHLVTAWATGQTPPAPTEPPARGLGARHPAAAWSAARDRCAAALTPTALEGTVTTRAFGSLRLAAFVATFPFDALAHAWDLATATGQHVDLPEPLVAEMLAWARTAEAVLRRPGGLGPALETPSGATEQQRFLAFTGRVGPSGP